MIDSFLDYICTSPPDPFIMLLEKLRNDMVVHPGCDYDEHSFPRLFPQLNHLNGASIVLLLRNTPDLAKGRAFRQVYYGFADVD